MIVKAHETLTDEASFDNYQKYGNPDGQLVTKFGIALPAWIVAEENHLYVLGVYGFLFGIMLPATVGSWWYRSLQFTGDQVLIKTTRMFEVNYFNFNIQKLTTINLVLPIQNGPNESSPRFDGFLGCVWI